jgi:hypothetical protein
MARVESDNTQLKIDIAGMTTDLYEIHDDLRILHPLPYARLKLTECIKIQEACNDAVNDFVELHTLKVINVNTTLSLQLQELKNILKKAWDARFAAAHLCEPPPKLENVVHILAKSGFTREVAPLMNLSKATRECKDLQRVMREVKSPRVVNDQGMFVGGRMTQLHYFCMKGMTSSVVRMLAMSSIDVEALHEDGGQTCLMDAALNGHLSICRLLIDKGAQVNAKDGHGWTAIQWAILEGHIATVRLLCDLGADVEAHDAEGMNALLCAAAWGRITIVKELVDKRNAKINARNTKGQTALTMARRRGSDDIASYLASHGGIE